MANILIVDDAAFMRNSFQFVLENGEHKVVGQAKDGEEALKMYNMTFGHFNFNNGLY